MTRNRSHSKKTAKNSITSSVINDMYDLNDDFTNELDQEMDILRKKNINSTESLIEKIMNTNLENIPSCNININLDEGNKVDLKTKSISRRKNNDVTGESSLLQIPKSNTRVDSQFTDLFEDIDKIARNFSSIPNTEQEYIHDKINLKYYTPSQYKANSDIKTAQKSFKTSQSKFSVIIKEDLMNFKFMSSRQYDEMYKQFTESLEDNEKPVIKSSKMHDLDKKYFNSIKRQFDCNVLDSDVMPDHKNNDFMDVQAKSIQISYVHSNKKVSLDSKQLSDISIAKRDSQSLNVSGTKPISQDKQKQKLRDDLNQSRIESECEDMNVDILKILLSDVEDYNTKLEEKQLELTNEQNEFKLLVKEQDEIIQELRQQISNSLYEKNEEMENVKNALTNEWIKKEIKAKMQYDQLKEIKDKLQIDNQSMILENDKIKTISEDLVKNQDLLTIKLSKKTIKLEKYENFLEAKLTQPNKSIQCNIELTTTTNIHSANIPLHLPLNSVTNNQSQNHPNITLTEQNLLTTIDSNQNNEIEQDKASLMSDDIQDTILKGKLSATKLIDLYHTLDNEQQDLFKDQVSVITRAARSSSVLAKEDRNDDQDDELNEKIKELEEDKYELMNENAKKNSDIDTLKKKLDSLHNEQSANITKNRMLNMDLVETRLLFKQQCCVLVYFLKIARKQLVKFKSYIAVLAYQSINQSQRYKQFGRKIVSQQEHVIHKEFRLSYGYTQQNRNQFNLSKMFTYKYNQLYTSKNHGQALQDKSQQEIKKLRINFNLIKNESRRSVFNIKLNQQEFSQIEACKKAGQNVDLDHKVQSKANSIANDLIKQSSNIIIESFRAEKYFYIKINSFDIDLQYKNLFIFINNNVQFFSGLKDVINQFIQRDGIIMHKHYRGKELENTIKEQFKLNYIEIESRSDMIYNKDNQGKPMAMVADFTVFNLRVYFESLFDS